MLKILLKLKKIIIIEKACDQSVCLAMEKVVIQRRFANKPIILLLKNNILSIILSKL